MKDLAEKYYNVLRGTFSGLNLVSFDCFDDFFLKQFIDSTAAYNQSNTLRKSIEKEQMVVDLGTGGGFPSIPLAGLLPDVRVLGVDARSKKIRAVCQIARELGLNNMHFVHSRFEELLFDIPVVCVVKAVGKINLVLNQLNATEFVKVFFYKGPGYLKDEQPLLSQRPLGWKLICEEKIFVEGLDERWVVGFEYGDVPRGTRGKSSGAKKLVSQKDLVKVSSFFENMG